MRKLAESAIVALLLLAGAYAWAAADPPARAPAARMRCEP